MEPNLFRYVWRHSRRDQILVLLLVLASLPFYFAAFDVPKRIINEAIQGRAFAGGVATVPFGQIAISLPDFLGGARWSISAGVAVTQLQLLWALSGLFLVLVIINGAFKFAINVSKGIIGERMLRRLRFELFTLILRFRPEDLKAVRPAEAATIIKDEVEPIGGFIGDAFIQPAFLSMQALTAVLFILVQSVWLGLVAVAVVAIQAYIVPVLRKEQLRLTRERQIHSRKLAGRIGEIVEAAPAVHTLGIAPYVQSDIGQRLGHLFQIRVALFKRKFAVKYINNLLAQITPFFFYAIGGYLALRGTIDIGQLVAAIAAYRDLPPPIKELIDWDQERADVTVKYQQIIAQYPTTLLPAATIADAPDAADDAAQPVRGLAFRSYRLTDSRGAVLLEPLTVDITLPAHVALVGPAGSARDVVARALGRQISEAQGRLTLDGRSLADLPDQIAGRRISYLGPEPMLLALSIRDNVTAALRRHAPDDADPTEDAVEALRRHEARRSGNPVTLPSDRWLDTNAIGGDLDQRIIALLSAFGVDEDIYAMGLLGKLDPSQHPDLIAHVPEARAAIGVALVETGLDRYVEQFDPDRYNLNATIGENVLFGVATGERLSADRIASDRYVRAILEAESLVFPLATIGVRMIEGAAEVFDGLPLGHPLFERFSYIPADEIDDHRKLADRARKTGIMRLSLAAQAQLIQIAFAYVEPRHRMDAITPALQDRLLRARASIRAYLPQAYAREISFYDPERYNAAASLKDNLLFGRITYGAGEAEARVNDAIRLALRRIDLEHHVLAMGLDVDAGPGGRQLAPRQRTAVAMARALIGEPDILVIDGALGALGSLDALPVLRRLREFRQGRSLIVSAASVAEVAGFDLALMFDGPRFVDQIVPPPDDRAAETVEPVFDPRRADLFAL